MGGVNLPQPTAADRVASVRRVRTAAEHDGCVADAGGLPDQHGVSGGIAGEDQHNGAGAGDAGRDCVHARTISGGGDGVVSVAHGGAGRFARGAAMLG